MNGPPPRGRRRIVLLRVVVEADPDDELPGAPDALGADASVHDLALGVQLAQGLRSLADLGPVAFVGSTAYYLRDVNPLQ